GSRASTAPESRLRIIHHGPLLFKILNKVAQISARIASFVNFPYHPSLPPQPSERAMSQTELEAFWMPFTANRQFKSKPRLLSKASGMHYWTPDGRQILDAVAGLWCVNTGHGRREITEAVSSQLETMDYAPP